MTRVLVTGAGGFIGRALTRELLHAGTSVIAAARGPETVVAGAEFRRIGDLGAEGGWQHALEGADAVVHLAGRAHASGSEGRAARTLYHRINAEATARLAEAALEAGARRFVFLSTVKVMGDSTGATPFRETDTPAPRGAYALSKWEAERALADIAAHSGLETVILRAPLVYGPGVKGNFRKLLTAVTRGWPLPLASVKNRRSLVYVGNLAHALHRCLEHRNAPGRTFLVRDGEDMSTPELMRRLAGAMGRPARLVPVPVSLLRVAGRLSGKGEAVARLVESLVVDDALIRARLDWRPPFTVEEGLAHTARWHQAEAEAARG